MAVLHVRDIPDPLSRRMQKVAKSHGRSLSAEVIALFEGAVRADDLRRQQTELLKAIRANRWTPPRGAPNAAAMLRAARAEREAEAPRPSKR